MYKSKGKMKNDPIGAKVYSVNFDKKSIITFNEP